MEPGHALICGAGIAGPATAYWLNRHGWDTTVIERADRFRSGGQNIDIRGAAREVMRRMGLEDAALQHGTGEKGTQFVDERGHVRAQFDASGPGDGPTAEMEILRGELSRLLIDRLDGQSELVTGDHVTAIADGQDKAVVSFANSADRAFDLIVVAEGAQSSTRDLIFGRGVPLRPVGLYMTWLAIPPEPHDTDWWRWYNAPGRRVATLRPGKTGSAAPADTKATLSFASNLPGLDRLDAAAQRQLLTEVFAGAGWEVPRILAALDHTSWFFERATQVRMRHWTTGRAALAGDTAWAPTPVTGMGTSLALIGAYVLAHHLNRSDTRAEAFAAYEDAMRDFVRKSQRLPPGGPRLLHPRTRNGIRVVHGVGRVLAAPPSRRLLALGSKVAPDTGFQLPAVEREPHSATDTHY
jgi:2-polyprenyl-6-methoxyphenol hydroxylase-like FAD-dependent oxidoreductase